MKIYQKYLFVLYTYTKKCAEAGNINQLKSCFHMAKRFLKKGNNAVESAMGNILSKLDSLPIKY